MALSLSVKTVGFEVFGKVQGVFFRKCAQEQARREAVTGWIRNTHDNTVKGELQGKAKAIEAMKLWLRTKGSPLSRIDKAVFVDVTSSEVYHSFEVLR